MKYTCATTVNVPITQLGRNYFPLVQKLRGKKIYTINFCSAIDGIVPLAGGTAVAGGRLYGGTTINLTEDGRFYFWDNLLIDRIGLNYNKGCNLPVNRQISIQDCFINVTAAGEVGRTAVLVVWYENDTYTHYVGDNAPNYYDTLDVQIDSTRTRNYLPDNRTLADKSFKGIFSATPIAGATTVITPLNHTSITESDLRKCYITLVKDSFEIWDAVPCYLLQQSDWYRYLQLNDIVLDLTSCYIQAAAGTTINGWVNLQLKYNA